MPTVEESAGVQQGSLSGALAAGVETLSENQTVLFVKYIRVILPLDGYAFWVKADLLSQSALANVAEYNAFLFNQPLTVVTAAPRFEAQGSLHYSSEVVQDLDEGYTANKVLFTSLHRIVDLDAVSPMVMYVAHVENFKYAFTRRGLYYKQSGLHHYEGDTINAVLENQLINSAAEFDTTNIVVSNSLPIWLSLNKFFPVFPSDLVPFNFPPPYAAVNVEETTALQAAPYIDQNSNHWQLVSDRVSISIFGTRNFNALDYLDYVFEQSLNTEIFGLMNSPVLTDEKRKQDELNIIAQKKTVEFEISYYQVRVRELARQLILSAIPSFIIAPQRPRTMFFVQDIPLGYEGPFKPAEVLPRILFMDTTTLSRGIAYTGTPADGTIQFFDQLGNLQILVTIIAGNPNPQVTFPNGPFTAYINQWLSPVANVNSACTDLSITLGTAP